MLVLAIFGTGFGSVVAVKASTNVALNKPATASSSTTQEVASRAVDGDLITNWCAPTFVGWIKVDLQSNYTVDSLKLYVNQALAGNTVHEVLVSEDMVNWVPVDTLSGYTSNNQWLTVKFNPVLANVRGVMLNTLTTRSWVAWYEIEVYSATTTGLNQISRKDVAVYTNPANNIVTVEGVTNGTVELINIKGQIVKTVKVSGLKTTMDLSKLASGVYSVKVSTNNGSIVEKIVKK